MKLKLFFMSCLLLIACTHEKNYRGVSENVWTQLNAEQKQLIVDDAFAEEFRGKNKNEK